MAKYSIRARNGKKVQLVYKKRNFTRSSAFGAGHQLLGFVGLLVLVGVAQAEVAIAERDGALFSVRPDRLLRLRLWLLLLLLRLHLLQLLLQGSARCYGWHGHRRLLVPGELRHERLLAVVGVHRRRTAG